MRHVFNLLTSVFLLSTSATAEKIDLFERLEHKQEIKALCESLLDSGTAGQPSVPLVITDDMIFKHFARVLQFWQTQYARHGWPWHAPKIKVLSETLVQTACGQKSVQNGVVYCFADETIYIFKRWFNPVISQIGNPTEAVIHFILGHEISHFVQAFFSRDIRLVRQGIGKGLSEDQAIVHARQMNEYQADCFAGVYMRDLLEHHEISQPQADNTALRLVFLGSDSQRGPGRSDSQVGNDHGSSYDRLTWFLKGLNSGSLELCTPGGLFLRN